MTYDGTVTLPSPRRSRILTWQTRTDTNDGALVVGIIANDEYGLGTLPVLSGTAIDIGAHIGTVALVLAADNPDLHVIAVEAVPENVEGLRINAARNGFDMTIIEAAAAAPRTKTVDLLWNYRTADHADQAYVDDSRFIANIFDADGSESDTHTVNAVSLDTLMKGLDRLALLKIDCEGCEWQFLRSKRVADVDIIIGEFHNKGGIGALRDLIGATHEVTQTSGAEDIGMFRAVRR
jgi:FkbM family methyltransferase